MNEPHTPIRLTECSREEILSMFVHVLQVVSAARLLVGYARSNRSDTEGVMRRLKELDRTCALHDWVLDLES